ncbi:Mpo1-like protein [Oceanicoccus sp. KOV_DT_Chl]|uniref:Mpo1-like protein n=1 Tax=Oceanicoccus sp. KOV_DT_Chl TaxID=1904639 RepID=UPI00190EA565|nr:Mpo1-like protein [Oceanicoccus sp. KOV_DT_Chl]
MQRRSLTQWLNEYSETHQHPTNKWIHFICVPAILFCTLGLLWQLPTPNFMQAISITNWALPLIVVSLVFLLLLIHCLDPWHGRYRRCLRLGL